LEERRPETGHRLGYLPALDGIRGLAVLAVLFFHGDIIRGGYLGVDAFFVLSGFLITSLLLAEIRDTRRVDLRAFWLRRARRLLPALFATLLGVAVFAALFASATELDRIRSDALATLGYVANWNSIAADHGYWSLFNAPSPLEHTWSLAIEEQFYLVWPIVMFLVVVCVRRVARWTPIRWRVDAYEDTTTPMTRRLPVPPVAFVLCLGLATASAYAMWARYDPSNTSRAYLGTDTRAASILIGAALAAFLAWRGPARRVGTRVALEVTALASAAALGVAWVLLDGQSELLYRGGFWLCGLGAAAVIASAAHPQPGVVARVLSVWPLRALGIISYGLYLWHWPTYVAMSEERTNLEGNALLAARIAVSILLATVSYFLLERPIRRGAFSGRRIAVAAPMTAAACALALVVATSGATTRSVAALPSVVSNPGAPEAPVARVDSALTTAASRLPERAAPRILVVGDSVAGSIVDVGWLVQSQYGVSLSKAIYPGCVLTPHVVDQRISIHRELQPGFAQSCEPTWYDGVRRFIPDLIVMIYGTGAAFTDLSIDGHWSTPCDPVYRSWYLRELTAIARRLGRTSAELWISRMPPMEADWLPDDANDRIRCLNQVHQEIADALPHVELLDLAEKVCPSGRCPKEFEGKLMRFDGMHFSTPAAVWLARWLIGEVLTAEPAESSHRVLPHLD
jgi:peptidoglycan/LPS O-acetylase OafA/YrhL